MLLWSTQLGKKHKNPMYHNQNITSYMWSPHLLIKVWIELEKMTVGEYCVLIQLMKLWSLHFYFFINVDQFDNSAH